MLIKIGLIEDNNIIRNNYEDYFKSFSEFKVLFAVSDWKNLFQINSSQQPDILLLDLMLPSGNSLKSIHKIKQLFPYSKIVILSAVEDPASSQLAFSNGAEGFLLKTSSLDYIRDSLIKTHGGGTPISPMIASHLIDVKHQNLTTQMMPGLTKRELELCNLAVTGMSNKMIANAMHVTFFTINQHLKSIYKKMNINSKSELISHLMSSPLNLNNSIEDEDI